jgi:isopentenyl-diphosphate delta-isomerase
MLVDSSGRSIGTMDKMAAHRKGALHRAFSVFIFNSNGELLLQQRALDKYHSGGQWTNTCCSHPRPGENTVDAAHRRLMEEMGLICELEEVFTFSYRHEFANGLTEHEYDHVFIGYTNEAPKPNPTEVADFLYLKPELLALELNKQPDKYTAWLAICFDQVMDQIKINERQ